MHISFIIYVHTYVCTLWCNVVVFVSFGGNRFLYEEKMVYGLKGKDDLDHEMTC